MSAAICRSALVAGLVLLTGCAHQQSDLYSWGDFPHQQYDALLHETPNTDEQIHTMEAQAEKARASNLALPPGFRAHLGMLYLNAGNADRAREMWVAEKSAFPESTSYMDRLLARLQAPADAAKKGAGA